MPELRMVGQTAVWRLPPMPLNPHVPPIPSIPMSRNVFRAPVRPNLPVPRPPLPPAIHAHVMSLNPNVLARRRRAVVLHDRARRLLDDDDLFMHHLAPRLLDDYLAPRLLNDHLASR